MPQFTIYIPFGRRMAEATLCESFLDWQCRTHQTIVDPNKVLPITNGRSMPVITFQSGDTEIIGVGFHWLYEYFCKVEGFKLA